MGSSEFNALMGEPHDWQSSDPGRNINTLCRVMLRESDEPLPDGPLGSNADLTNNFLNNNYPYTAKKCGDLPAPKGGAKACDDWFSGTFCSPFCQNNTDFAQALPKNRYVCGASGTWSPSNRFPDCSSK